MKYFLLMLTVLFLNQSLSLAEEKMERGKYVNIYKADNYEVSILRYGKEDLNQFLIKIKGIDNEQDGKTYLHTKKCDDTKCKTYKYITTEVHKPDGKQWFTIYNDSSWGDQMILQPYLVERKGSEKLYLSKTDKMIEGIEVQDFVDAYLKQQKSVKK